MAALIYSLFSFSYTCYRESLEGSRVTKSVTVLISVFTECFLRDTPQTRFILCSIKRKQAVSLKPILNIHVYRKKLNRENYTDCNMYLTKCSVICSAFSVHDPVISDHLSLHCNLHVDKPPNIKKRINY